MWSRQGHSAAMSQETLRGTLELAFDTPETEPVDVRFAGGEPLLAGRDWLETAFTITREGVLRLDHGCASARSRRSTS
jgi:sulfatase maturation enzyme AslB (radical SAM superfamily)